MKLLLSDNVQAQLRNQGVISAQEVAFKFGDLIIAEDSISGVRRHIENVPSYVLESMNKPGILKG
jgi:hypothetical protein